MCDVRCLVVLAVLTGGLAYWLHYPAPPGYSDPWQFQIGAAMGKLAFKYIDIGDYFGFLDRVPFHRNMWHQLVNKIPPAEDGIKTFDTKFDGVSVRIYEPDNKKNNGPGLVYLHGGGWVIGSVDVYEHVVRYMVKKLGMVAISVDYRLAPEYPFPVPFEDCVTAVMHFLKNAESFGVDPNRVILSGDSAGGNLVGALLLKFRDTGFTPKPKLGVMIYPAVQALDFKLPSMQQHPTHPTLPVVLLARFFLQYAQGHDRNLAIALANGHVSPAAKKALLPKYVNHEELPKESFGSNYVSTNYDSGNETLWSELEAVMTNPYYAPLLAKDLRNLPVRDLMVITMADDVLRDEGILFAKRAKNDGNSVLHTHLTYGYHGLYLLASDEIPIPKSKVDAFQEIFKFIESKI